MRKAFLAFVALLACAPPVALAFDNQDKDIFKALSPQTVRVEMRHKALGEQSHGTGFWYSDGGIAVIVTAKHCVEGETNEYPVVIDSKGKEYTVYQTIKDKDNDIAVLYVGDDKRKTFSFAKSTPEVGEDVWLTGYPFWYGLTLCKGLVTNNSYPVDMWLGSLGVLSTLSAAPGCSGGAVVNFKLEIVGMFVLYNTNNSNYTVMVPAPTMGKRVPILMQQIKRELAK